MSEVPLVEAPMLIKNSLRINFQGFDGQLVP
jgi:hypothetical protein